MLDTSTAPSIAAAGETRESFDGLTIALHWATVLLVLSQFGTAWSIDNLDPSFAPTALTIHRSSGVVLWLLVAGRLLWRLTGMRKPPFPATIKPLHGIGVRISEYVLYALLLVQPITGVLDSIFRGRAFDLFLSTFPAIVHRDRHYASLAHTAHEVGAYSLAALVCLHAFAALTHHFILKDEVLVRMLPRKWG
jgi:superoxide oxidase